jgi:hypothetical protein
MTPETLVSLASVIVLVAVQWGWMRGQIATLSRRMDAHDDTRERLARIEAKLDYITPHKPNA